MQLIDNQVDARTGTVRVRAVFDNPDGRLIPGQFARLRMGQAKTEPALAVNERAIGTDQDKKYVLVVDADNKAAYREVTLGAAGRRAAHRDQRAASPASASSSTACSASGPGAVVEPQMRVDGRANRHPATDDEH